MITCEHGDTFKLIKDLGGCSTDIIFADPPYSFSKNLTTNDYTDQIIDKIQSNEIDEELFELIQNNNKLGVPENSKDFMGRWQNPTGNNWEVFFKESFRILKHGGFVILYGMEEAGSLFNYYASMSGFLQNQNLYYMFGQSFPKNLNLSKCLEKKIEKALKEKTGRDKIEWV